LWQGYLSQELEEGARETSSGENSVRCAYFRDESAFPELEDFVGEMEAKYSLRIAHLDLEFKKGCKHMMDNFGTKCFLLGWVQHSEPDSSSQLSTPKSRVRILNRLDCEPQTSCTPGECESVTCTVHAALNSKFEKTQNLQP